MTLTTAEYGVVDLVATVGTVGGSNSYFEYL